MMPIIRRHARSLFRHLTRQERDDAFAEVTAVAMIDFIGLLKRDQAGSLDPAALARSAALKVLRSGRACGRESCRDVLSPTAQQRRGFAVECLQDSYEQERLRTRIRLREDAEPFSARQPGEPPANDVGQSGSMNFTHERRRRRKAEKRLHASDLESQLARRIQQRLFPAASPIVPGFEIAGMTCPAEATGGDYFDYVPMADEGVGVVIGDVSGHGFGPALLMASTRAYMRAFAQTHSDLGELLALVNRVLIMDMEDGRFVTVVLARFDTRTRSLVYASAGHPTAYVLSASGQIRLCLPSRSLPLGLALDERFSASGVIQLQPGEIVVLLSDGVTEALAPDGAAFGSTRAVNIVRCYCRDPAARIVANLYHAVRAFSQNAPQLDDITAVVIKINQEKNGSRLIELRGSDAVRHMQNRKSAEVRIG
jgi:serine phosphatase RsbU (regulator of sigma subunit)